MGWLDGLLPSDDERANLAGKVRGGMLSYLNGANAMVPQTNADAAQMALSMTPGIGNVMSAQDAYSNAQQGDWGRAAASAFGMIPFMGGGMIKAFHGSPHNFDNFSMSKIGTGEGAQVYGHGLYFADNPKVAEMYKEQLATPHIGGVPENPNDPLHIAAGAVADAKGNRTDALTALQTQHNLEDDPALKQLYSQAASHIESGAELPSRDFKGHMYEVNINADPEHFLDWDKPLKEQAQPVKDALAKTSWGPDYLNTSFTGGQVAPKSVEGSQNMAQLGIPGVKYLDQASRGAGEGSRNYVVFDDKLVNVVRKYGIPGAIGLGLITPEIGRQMQDQGI